jgi:hypothetical protein
VDSRGDDLRLGKWFVISEICNATLFFLSQLSRRRRGRENRGFMASSRQTMKLYWVTTADHDEDWFVFAESARETLHKFCIHSLID